MARPRSRWLTVAIAVVAAAAVLELAARGMLAFWPSIVPAPPPVELGRNLDASGLPDLLHPDPTLLFALDRNVDTELARSYAYDPSVEQFHVRTDERGFRTPPFADAKPAGVTRIVALGDAVTFGAYVNDDQTYARQLAARLEAVAPGRFEVINLGVPGYSSRQGLELLQRQVLALHPDVVLFAYGHADRALRAAESDDARLQSRPAAGPLGALVARSAALQLLDAMVGREPALRSGADDVPRGSLNDIAAAIVAAQFAVQNAGGRLLVVNADFGATDAVEGLRRGVQQTNAEYVDLVGAVRAAAQQHSTALAVHRQLPPVNAPAGKMTFRVEAPQQYEVWVEVLRGVDAALVPMRDDGTNGDQIAGDDVFTAFVSGSPGERLPYTYRAGTVLGPVREFTSGKRRNPSLRRTVFRPDYNIIDQFGVVPLMADPTLPDAEGHALMAQVLASRILTPPPAPAAAAPPAAPAATTTSAVPETPGEPETSPVPATPAAS